MLENHSPDTYRQKNQTGEVIGIINENNHT